jgi:hypothetical protein
MAWREHIATFDPPTVLALIAAVSELSQALARAEQRVVAEMEYANASRNIAARLHKGLVEARDLLLEKTQGSPARSAGHNARLAIEAAIDDARDPMSVRTVRQNQVQGWVIAAFGREHATCIPQRATRFLEEAVELFQACIFDEMSRGEDIEHASRQMAHKLVDYVFGRPPGTIAQEVGGVGLTLLSLCEAAGIDADGAEATELARVLSKPLDHFHKRNEEKNAAGFDVTGGAYPTVAHHG